MCKTMEFSTEKIHHIYKEIKPLQCGLPEIWGGLECTINRIGDNFRDQFEYAGHYQRPDDLDKIAGLGIKKIRYPVLWERHSASADDTLNWQWTESQLQRILDLGMEPIAGLVHHGSGPAFTNLLDPDFSELLAEFAGRVSEKFPFIKYYTPINEPLTTARFSGLYGWWYPHKKDQRSFARMLVNQCRAIIRAMQEIRKHNPDAKLVQTEDLGKTYSKPALKYQADFENKRRWFSLDLLCGKCRPGSDVWNYLKQQGIEKETLQFFEDNKLPPDVLGFNYYITSERYLDDDLDNYPSSIHGGNGRHTYVDIEAIRISMPEPHGLKHLLSEAWMRYGSAMAITEVHIGCTREEQMRWLRDVWETCCSLRENGIDIKAVTPWSLLGAFDWNSLLTKEKLHYEAGVFDISSGVLRPTAIADMIKGLSTGNGYHHPLLKMDGWWKRNLRFLNSNPQTGQHRSGVIRPLLVIGKHGTLAKAFATICELRSIPTENVSRNELNILDANAIKQKIQALNPWAVVNCAGFVDVDKAEIEREECMRINAEAPALLAEACKEANIPFMTFSSDLVFNGEKKNPYTETDQVQPLNFYGETKALAEERVLAINPSALIVRTSAFFGPWDKYNFVYSVLRSIEQRISLELPADVIVSPTYVPDLVHASLDLLIDRGTGIWHLANHGFISWADFAQEVARQSDKGVFQLVRKKLEDMSWTAQRPIYSVLETEKGQKLPTLDNALERYFRESVAV